MEQLHFQIEINADVASVYNIMLSKETYDQWADSFSEGSTYEGSWAKGSKIYFIGPTEDGRKQGMVALIKENIPNQRVTITVLGFIDGDVEITTGPMIDGWVGAIEEYTFSEKNGKTTLNVSVDVNLEHKEHFEKTWPMALNKLKEICENPNP